ncbi:MAG: peptidoglycan DD-metalloendopeptidase family protein [Gammaproteobacteria bacterium]|nr:peptidoglycan DD-metalloendopeptidase family protein [Gammaproteobacteria bacterium]MDH5652987.1 peptidoglycan DD-metalloendopeptidase family protein [Gammaproteobacteria bacterium]
MAIHEDNGNYFRLELRNNLFWDYERNEGADLRGETKLERKWFEPVARFQILDIANTVEQAAVDSKTYQTLLVVFDEDRDNLEMGVIKDDIRVDADYFKRLERAGVPEALIANLKTQPLLQEPITDFPDFLDRYYQIMENLETENPDLHEFYERHEDEVQLGLISGYLWNIYQDTPYAFPEVPDVKADEAGINVVNLQLWLKLLGYNPGEHDGIMGPLTVAATNEFRAKMAHKGAIINEPEGIFLTRRTWYLMEALLQKKLPPDPVTLERIPFPCKRDFENDAAYYRAVYEGLKGFGFPIETTSESVQYELDVIDGKAYLDNIPQDDYEIVLDDINVDYPQAIKTPSATGDGGSLDIQIENETGEPYTGKVFLVKDVPDRESLAKAVRLFKAIVRNVDRFENQDGENQYSQPLSGELGENSFMEEAWDDFSDTWGMFYGAPWKGIILDPGDGLNPAEWSWGRNKVVNQLVILGNGFISNGSYSQCTAALNKPIALRHISKPLEAILEKIDFSQTGTQVSYQVPSTETNGISGKYYGNSDYKSENFDRDYLNSIIECHKANSIFVGRILCPDDFIVNEHNSNQFNKVFKNAAPESVTNNAKFDYREGKHLKHINGLELKSEISELKSLIKDYYEGNVKEDGKVVEFAPDIKNKLTDPVKIQQAKTERYNLLIKAIDLGNANLKDIGFPLKSRFSGPWPYYIAHVKMSGSAVHKGIDMVTWAEEMKSLAGYKLFRLNDFYIIGINIEKSNYVVLRVNLSFNYRPFLKEEKSGKLPAKFVENAGTIFFVENDLCCINRANGIFGNQLFRWEFSLSDNEWDSLQSLKFPDNALKNNNWGKIVNFYVAWHPKDGLKQKRIIAWIKEPFSYMQFNYNIGSFRYFDSLKWDENIIVPFSAKKEINNSYINIVSDVNPDKIDYVGKNHAILRNESTGLTCAIDMTNLTTSMKKQWTSIKKNYQLLYLGDNQVLAWNYKNADYAIYKYERNKANDPTKNKDSDSLKEKIFGRIGSTTHHRPVASVNDGQAKKFTGGAYGNHVKVYFFQFRKIKFYTLYAHLDKIPAKISLNKLTTVKRGEFIGVTGKSGPPNTPVHLHYGIYFEGGKDAKDAIHAYLDKRKVESSESKFYINEDSLNPFYFDLDSLKESLDSYFSIKTKRIGKSIKKFTSRT